MADGGIRRRAFLAASCAAVAAIALPSCGGSEAPLFERIMAGETIRVGFANEAPYAYLDPETGELTGEAPEMAREVLARLGSGATLEPVLTEFGSLIPGLQAGRFDVIAAGMYVTKERAREIAFSDPTYSIGEAFMVRSDNPLDLHSYEDVVVHGTARLGVVAGAVQLGYARDLGVPEERVVVFPDAQSAVAGLQADRIDAYAGTSLTVNDLVRQAGDSGLVVADEFEDPILDGKVLRGFGAFGFRKTDADAVEAFNAVLSEFVNTPAHRVIVAPFGFGESEMPGNVTTDGILAD